MNTDDINKVSVKVAGKILSHVSKCKQGLQFFKQLYMLKVSMTPMDKVCDIKRHFINQQNIIEPKFLNLRASRISLPESSLRGKAAPKETARSRNLSSFGITL